MNSEKKTDTNSSLAQHEAKTKNMVDFKNTKMNARVKCLHK